MPRHPFRLSPLRPFLLSALLSLLATACYEDVIDCLDPDAANYNILADEGCADCCTFPRLSLDVDRFWGEEPLSLADTFTDAAGNQFQLLRFRTYLSELEVVAGNVILPTPENEVEAGIITGTDTTLTAFNANLVLLESTGGTNKTVGELRLGELPLTALRGDIGFAETFPAVFPPLAPAASPLSTQRGLLNFNDGRGYLTASAEYVLLATRDTIRIDVRGNEAFTLNFPGPLLPLRGFNLTLEVAADYQLVFGDINLAGNENDVAASIFAGLGEWLRITGAR
jgi:hypothetical protein